jgi:drug/metabolite transporter (DMT)-like permease
MDWILLIVPGVIWGASFLFIAEGLEAMGPNGVTFTRILVGFLTLALFRGSRRQVSRDDWLGIALVGVLWMAFPLSMFPFAEQHVSSALTGMLNGAVPLFTAIVAAGIALATALLAVPMPRRLGGPAADAERPEDHRTPVPSPGAAAPGRATA